MKRVAVELTREDRLRLEVLAVQCHAIRIDDAQMTVRGLTDTTELAVRLASTSAPDRYLRAVRELLSSIATGSPGGYPVFLTRWTRTGQFDSDRLARLLKLGEPEAVVAVASSPSLTVDIAQRAWWAHPEPETARYLLQHVHVRQSPLGTELAGYIREYIPFETEPLLLAENVRLLLLVGELSMSDRVTLWRRGQRKTAILLGFVQACPFKLPQESDADENPVACRTEQDPEDFDDWFEALCDARGQTLFATFKRILDKPADQEVVVAGLKTLADLLRRIRPCNESFETIESIESEVARVIESIAEVRFFPSAKVRQDRLESLLFLSLVSERLVQRYFSRSTTVGSLMRRQLACVLDPVCERLHVASG